MYLKDLNADGLIRIMFFKKQYSQQKIYNYTIRNNMTLTIDNFTVTGSPEVIYINGL